VAVAREGLGAEGRVLSELNVTPGLTFEGPLAREDGATRWPSPSFRSIPGDIPHQYATQGRSDNRSETSALRCSEGGEDNEAGWSSGSGGAEMVAAVRS